MVVSLGMSDMASVQLSVGVFWVEFSSVAKSLVDLRFKILCGLSNEVRLLVEGRHNCAYALAFLIGTESPDDDTSSEDCAIASMDLVVCRTCAIFITIKCPTECTATPLHWQPNDSPQCTPKAPLSPPKRPLSTITPSPSSLVPLPLPSLSYLILTIPFTLLTTPCHHVRSGASANSRSKST